MVTGVLELVNLAGIVPKTHTLLMNVSDITYVAYLIICVLIAIGISGGGGGRRSRLPVEA